MLAVIYRRPVSRRRWKRRSDVMFIPLDTVIECVLYTPTSYQHAGVDIQSQGPRGTGFGVSDLPYPGPQCLLIFTSNVAAGNMADKPWFLPLGLKPLRACLLHTPLFTFSAGCLYVPTGWFIPRDGALGLNVGKLLLIVGSCPQKCNIANTTSVVIGLTKTSPVNECGAGAQ
jgi:hypothetical protein